MVKTREQIEKLVDAYLDSGHIHKFSVINIIKEDIVAQGFDQNIVEKIIKLLHAAEFKRQQSAPGTKISKMCFNIDRRYPITNKFLK